MVILLLSFMVTSSDAAFALAPSGKLNDESFHQAYAALDSTTRTLDVIGEALYLKMPLSGVREMVERLAGRSAVITLDRIGDGAVYFSFRSQDGSIKYFRCFLSEDGVAPAGADTVRAIFGANTTTDLTFKCDDAAIDGTGTPIPEPTSMLLLGSGLVGLLGFSRKKLLK